MEKKRVYWLDAAKLLLMFLVVLGHHDISGLPRVLIWSFHMPAFFMISGYLYKKKSFTRLLISGIKAQMIPYIIGGLLSVATASWLRRIIFVDYFGITKKYHDIYEIIDDTFIHWNGWSLLWFLPCLFGANILFGLFIKVLGNCHPLFQLLCVIGMNLFALRGSGKLGFFLNNFQGRNVLMVMPFMLVGYWMANTNKKNSKRLDFSFVCISLAIIGFCFFNNIYINIAVFSYPRYPLCMLEAIGCVYIFFILVKKIPYHKGISLLGRNTLIIYLVHAVEHNFIPWKSVNEFISRNNNMDLVFIETLTFVVRFLCIIALTALICYSKTWLYNKFGEKKYGINNHSGQGNK